MEDADDIDTRVIFDESQWIGLGKAYPKRAVDVPASLAFFRDEQLSLPEFIEQELRAIKETNVEGLLKYHLPSQSLALASVKAMSCFKEGDPNDGQAIHALTLFRRSVPSRQFISQALDCVGQALLDGKRSFEDPQYPTSRQPLWILRYWNQVVEILEGRSRWKGAVDWLNTNLRAHSVNNIPDAPLKRARSNLLRMRWNEDTDIPGSYGNSTTNEFSRLLGHEWVSDTNMNMMFAHLSNRLESDRFLDSCVIIETLRLMQDLEKANGLKAHSTPLTPFLRRLEERIKKEDEAPTLVFPAFMKSQKHWIAIRVDFFKKTWCYGDSLSHRGMPEPKTIIQKVDWWLKGRFSSEFRCDGDSLEHGKQDDSTECGLAATNAIAHDIFSDPLWSSKKKVTERIMWFNKLVDSHIRCVNEASDLRRPRYHTPSKGLEDLPRKGTLASVLNSVNTNERIIESEQPSPTRMGITVASPVLHAARSISALLNTETLPMDIDEAMESQGISPTQVEVLENPAMDLDSSGTHDGSQIADHGFSTNPSSTSTATVYDALQKGMKRVREDEQEMVEKEGKRAKGVGKKGHSSPAESTSKSSTWTRLQNRRYEAQLKNGESGGVSVSEVARSATFKATILQYDARAVIIDPKQVRHFKCGKVLQMRAPRDTQAFKSHIDICKGPPKSSKTPGGGMNLINTFFNPGPKSKSASSAISSLPCPGLDHMVHTAVGHYLDRTGAMGGGGSSVSSLAAELYSKKYAQLSTARKRQVRVAQRRDWLWINDTSQGRVYSTTCTKYAGRESTIDSLIPCIQCTTLMSTKRFKAIIRVKMPETENFKYLNHTYRNSSLALIYAKCAGIQDVFDDANKNNHSPLVGYVQTVVKGQNNGAKFLLTLLQAADLQRKRQERGKGNQFFQYSPKLREWANIIHSRSAKVYEFMQEYLPLPHPRTLKRSRAREGRFPIGISEKTFESVKKYLVQLEYSGPVALSCDDTKLHPSFRPYYDAVNEGYYVLGHVGEPVRLADPEAFRQVIEQGELVKGTKLRLWCCQVPLPKVATIIVAAMCIPDSVKTDDLLQYLWDIISGFLRHRIKVVSYCADGSGQERKVQKQIEDKATSRTTHTIAHPIHGCNTISFDLLFFLRCPITMLQDSKHFLKTACNNLFSGARFLVFPNGVATYADIREMGYASASPLYMRDVEKVDRQDDNAATRLFSAASLEWFQNNHPEHLAVIVYLFVMGEVVDAYQNRFISIAVRVQMVLRAYFFLEMWKIFLESSGYPLNKYFVSPQCAAIMKVIIIGFLQLVIIYRDHTDGSIPFLPWLHSTEVVEHIFGMCRQLIKDFTMLDFHYMVPKLFIFLREHVFRANSSDGKGTASGYSHTYADCRSINIASLYVSISDSEIQDAAGRGYLEADSLFALLGMPGSDLWERASGSMSHGEAGLPSIRTWMGLVPTDGADIYADDESESESESVSVDEEPALLQDIIDQAEDLNTQSHESSRLNSLRCAAIAISTEEENSLLSLRELSSDEMEEALADDAEAISSILVAGLPALQISGENPSNSLVTASTFEPEQIDLSSLISLRKAHQTRQAELGVRMTVRESDGLASCLGKEALVKKRDILRELNKIVKEYRESAIGSGANRNLRWTSTTTTAALSGNAANAAAVLGAAGNRALVTRRAHAKKYGLSADIEDAGISKVRPLQAGTATGFGFALHEGQLLVVKVITLHSRSGGKTGTLGYISSHENIAGVANLGCQLYEHAHGSTFRATPMRGNKVIHPPRWFGLIVSSQFLCVLKSKPRELPSQDLVVSQEDAQDFLRLKTALVQVTSFVAALTKKKGSATVDGVIMDDIDEE